MFIIMGRVKMHQIQSELPRSDIITLESELRYFHIKRDKEPKMANAMAQIEAIQEFPPA